MKSVVALLLALPAVALAQVIEPPPCWPKDAGGTGTPIVVRAGIAGLAYAWHCPVESRLIVVAGPWSAFVPNFEAEARRIAAAPDADKRAAWVKYNTRVAALSDGVVKLKLAAIEDVKARYVK